jgi:hypothetical protein
MPQQPLADERTLLNVAGPVHALAGVGQRLLGGMNAPLRAHQLLTGGMKPSARSEHELSRGADQAARHVGRPLIRQHQHCDSRSFLIPKEERSMRATRGLVNRQLHPTARPS